MRFIKIIRATATERGRSIFSTENNNKYKFCSYPENVDKIILNE